MSRISYREALRQGLREALTRDPRVFLMGEDVGRYGGTFAVTKGLLDEFGEERVRDTPLSELGFVAAGVVSSPSFKTTLLEAIGPSFCSVAAIIPLPDR